MWGGADFRRNKLFYFLAVRMFACPESADKSAKNFFFFSFFFMPAYLHWECFALLFRSGMMVNGDCGWFIPATSCWPPSTRSSFAFDHHSLNTFASHRLAIVKARPPHQTRSTATPYTGSQGRRTNCNFEHKFAKPTTDCYGMNDKLLLLFSKVATVESGGGGGRGGAGLCPTIRKVFGPAICQTTL